LGKKGFKRVSLLGSEELFRPTRPDVVETEDTIAEVVERKPLEKHYRTVHLTPEEVDLLLEAIQTAKYPERQRSKPSLDRHERLDALRDKLQAHD
jgi:hypothetical protein